MQSRSLTSIAAAILLLLAMALQIPLVQDMAARLLKQSTPLIHSVRGVLPQYKGFNPPTFLALLKLNRPPSSQQPHTHRTFTTSSKMADSQAFSNLVEERRTYYQLTNESTISDARIKELVNHTIKHVPSPFNSQTTRAVVVLKEHHQKLWDSIMEVYKVMLPDDKFQHAKGRFDGFRAAYGTVSKP